MKKFSKGLIMLVILALIAGIFIGCRPTQAPVVTSGGTGEISGDLIIWIDNEDWAREIIRGFNRHYPNVNVSYEIVGNVDSRGMVSLSGPSGTGPDVFFMPHDHIANAYMDDVCLPFPTDLHLLYSSFVLDAAMQTCTFDGKLYAVPFATENIAFFYNKDLLGNTPVPETFEEVVAFARRYNNAANNQWAMRWAVDDAYHNYFWLTAFGFSVFGPNRDNYRTPGFDSSAVRQGLEYFSSMRDALFNVDSSDTTWDATVAAFQRGEVPFTITGPWAIQEAKDNGVNFGITKIPTINGRQPRSFSGAQVVAVSSYSKNVDAARAFVSYLVSVEGQSILFRSQGKLPAYADVSKIEGLKDDEYLAGIMEQAPFADPMPVIVEVQLMWEPLAELFRFTWNRDLTPQEAQVKAMETYDLNLTMSGKSR